MIKGLHHNAYRCRDSEETRAFYEDFLGLPFVGALEINTTKTGREAHVLHTFFQMEDGSYLAFFDDPDTPFDFKVQHDFDLHIALEINHDQLEPMLERGRQAGIECRGISERMYFPIDGSYYYSVMVFSNVTEGEKLSFRYYSSLDDEIIEYAETEEFIANMNDWNGLNTFSLSRIIAPEEFGLGDAYPNPFNPTTSLTLDIPEAGQVSVQVYNLIGQVVATLASGYMDADTYTLTWDASNLSSGMYFVKAETAGKVTTQKLMLMK